MIETYLKSYSELSLDSKREILLKEVSEILSIIEELCTKKKIDIEKLNSSNYIKNRELLFEKDYYDLLFMYIIYIKEDLASLLST